MTLTEWTHSEATLKQLAPSVYKALSVNIERAEQRKREAWSTIRRRIEAQGNTKKARL